MRDTLGCPASMGGEVLPPLCPGVTLCALQRGTGDPGASQAAEPIPRPEFVDTRDDWIPMDHTWCQHHCPGTWHLKKQRAHSKDRGGPQFLKAEEGGRVLPTHQGPKRAPAEG